MRLVCKQNVKVTGVWGGVRIFTRGEEYEIIQLNDNEFITDDTGECHFFNTFKGDFYTEIELRKVKLNELEKR